MSNRDCIPGADGATRACPANVGHTLIPGQPGAGKTACNVFYDMLPLTQREFRTVRGGVNPSDDAPDAGAEPCA